MMKTLILFLLLTTGIFGQKLNKTPYYLYNAKMEAKAISLFSVHLQQANRLNYLSFGDGLVRVSMRTKLNFSDSLQPSINDIGMSNNIRTKIYLSKNVRINTDIAISGVRSQSYQYSTGIIIKW